MPYACEVDLLRILRATLSLLEAADYPEKETPQTQKVAHCLREAISGLETPTPATNDALAPHE
jgi:hypothetical protein